MRINLKLLQAFTLVAEYGSFRQAAGELGRSPAAISMQIRDLEQQLGISLFQRTTRRVELTVDGRYLLKNVHQAMASVSATVDEILDAVEERRGRVRIGSSPSIASTYLPAILSEFQLRHPSVTLSVRELVSMELLDAIRRQDVDFGVGPVVPGASEFSFETIIQDPICALVPISLYGQRTGDNLSLDDLATMPAVVLMTMSALRSNLDEALARKGVVWKIQCEVQQASTAVALAVAGLGVAIVPRISVPEPAPRAVRVMSIATPALSREIAIITLRGKTFSASANHLAKLVKHSLQTAFAPASTA